MGKVIKSFQKEAQISARILTLIVAGILI